jgi:hypothetical protein
MKSDWEIVKQYSTKNESIVFIRDLDLGRRSVTNDAEAVFLECQRLYGQCRVVYQDSEGEWCEIVYANFAAFFKPWHGLVWDKLTKV